MKLYKKKTQMKNNRVILKTKMIMKKMYDGDGV